MSKKLICCMIALLLLSVCLPVLAETAGPVPALLPSVRTPVSGMDGADAFAGYVNRVFGIGGASAITPRNASLTGFNKAIYDLLVPLIEDTAAGNIASSVFTVDVSDAAAQLGIQPDDLMYSPEDLGLSSFYDDEHNLSGEALNAYYQRAGFNMGTIVHALMVNLPYDLYWFDKTSGFSPGIHLYTTDEEEKMTLFDNGELTLFMDVAQEFSAGSTAGTTDLNTALTSAASSAAATARMIAESSGQLSDFAKLSAFKDAVCHRVSYDHEAAEDDHRPYGNPWQLIWVFDDDPDTNVVCEGYSKAFKYLCDLSSFTNPDLSVSIVSGWMSGGTGEGPHMWNLVSMGSGANYLADITNCDEGSVGYPDELFMAGSGRPYSDNGLSGYIFSANGSDIVYAYDGDMAGLYTETELTVSDTAYTEAEPQIVANGVCGDDLTWTLDENGLLTVSGTGNMYDYHDASESPWSSGITQAFFGEGVTSIGSFALAGHSLYSVSLPASLVSIGEGAFEHCSLLASITLAEENACFKVVDNVLFSHDGTELILYPSRNPRQRYAIPAGVSVIRENAFYCCAYLTGISIPEGVSRIGHDNFTSCSLTSVTIPASVAQLDRMLFIQCKKLQEILVDDGNTEYMSVDGVLLDQSGTSLLVYPGGRTGPYTIPAGVTTVNDNAFDSCYGLTEVVCPDTLTAIGNFAFSGSSLTVIRLPAGLLSVGTRAFDNCPYLTDVYYPGTAEDWSAVSLGYRHGLADNALHFNDSDFLASGTCGENLTWTLDHEGTLTVSGTGEMYGGWNEEENPWAGHKAEILHAVVEQGVTSLGLAAFRECVNLTDISLPDSLTHIGYQALSGCYSLTGVTIPDSVIFIGRWAFAGCPITSITIPASVTEIEFGAFSYCNQLEEINIAYGNPSYLVDEDGVLFTADQTKLLWYPVPRTQTSYTVPDTVTTLDGNAFSICNNLHEIILPAGLSTIGASAFDQCQNLTDVYYRGSQYRWLSIDCQDGNGALSAAQLHFAPVSGACGENLTWALDGDGVLTISGTGPMTDYETDTAVPWSACRDEIVRAVIGPGVASLGAQAFHHCRNLTGVSLPEGLTAIGGSAFHMCERLADIDIPESVTAIDQFAFCGCYALTGIDIPANVASIGYGALSYCHSLAQLTVDPANTAFVIRDGVLFTADQTELVCYPPMKTGTSYSVPSTVTFVRDLAFTYCVHLENVTLPDQAVLGNEVFGECANLTSVSLPSALPAFTYKMFASCTSLTGLTIPSSVTAIESHAFQGCSSLTGTLVIPSSVTRIGNSAFQFCSGLTGLSLPSSLTSIGAWSFQNCSGIGSLTLPEGLTAIEDGAFSGCSGLTGDLIIPSAVTVIGQWAFSGCTGLNGTLTLPPFITGIEVGTFQNCTHLTGTVALPSSVACIGDLAFQYCEKLTGLILPSSLTSIGGWSFQNCTGIVSPLALPEGLTAIADGAFSGCSGLTGNLVLPSTLTSLGRWVFSGCTGFSGYLQIPGSLPGIADATFFDCNGLTNIYYAGTADEWHAAAPNPGPYNGAALHFGAAVSASGWFGTGNPFLWILDSRGHLLVRGSGDMESFWDDQDIPWFPYRQDIIFLTVTPGVTGIGANAFKQLTRLISVFLPDGLEYIGGCAFDHCESLPEISLPESVATIDWYSFGSCYALTDIFIPRSLTTIGDAALAYCFELSQITVDADNPAFTTDDGVLLTMDRTELVCYPPKKDNDFYFVPDTVTTIRTEAFSACENLSLIFLPPRLESIGESAFSWCSQLSQIRIPAGVTAIPQKAFSYCSSLTAIHIPASVRHIGNNAFYRCDRLAAVYYFGTQQEWNAVIIEDNNESLTNAVLRIIFPDLILPAQLTAIESEAFAGVPEGSVIFVPDTVTAIAPDAFDPGTIIITPADSYAAGWAAENGFVCFEQ